VNFQKDEKKKEIEIEIKLKDENGKINVYDESKQEDDEHKENIIEAENTLLMIQEALGNINIQMDD